VKRIDVHYDGNLYTISNRELAEVQEEIAAAQREGGWLLVNNGEGTRRDAYIWVRGGIPIALVPIPAEPVV